MDIAFNHSNDGLPITFVQMAKIRGRNDFRQYNDYGFNRNRSFQGGGPIYSKPPKWRALIRVLIIAIFAALILIVLLGWLWGSLTLRLEKYTFLKQTAKVAELKIQKTREGEDQLSIVLTLLEPNGFQKSYTLPLLQGDKVILQDESILVPPLPGFLELHSGYIVISLDVLNKNGTRVYSLQLNEAENDNSIPAQLVSLLVTRKYGSIALMPSRSIYKICITPTGQLKEC
jgi:hypothetical protein